MNMDQSENSFPPPASSNEDSPPQRRPGQVWTLQSRDGTQLIMAVIDRVSGSMLRVYPVSVEFENMDEQHGDCPVNLSDDENPLGYDIYIQKWCAFSVPPEMFLAYYGSLGESLRQRLSPHEDYNTGIDHVDRYRVHRRENLLEGFASSGQSGAGRELSDADLDQAAGGLSIEPDPEERDPDEEE